ncbi:MAG: HNH endonuclease [Candidatus Competibacteraceae bacterium]|nr:HNH endonuclease [Candidatus Competibacteraceae bacterium]MCB1813267.1 HNH endonuclease [Candidatus Competibacteraceae bacterium]
MATGICYLCCAERELTAEHILPQSLGGVLKERIYCADCNNTCGQDVDAEIARQFGRYATLMQVARERKVNQPFEIFSDAGRLRLKVDGQSILRSDPVVRIEKGEDGGLKEVEVIARSESELRKIFKKLAQKYNIEPNISAFEKIENPAPIASHDFVLDNALIHRAVSKIAYGFACIKLPKEVVLSAEFSAIRDFILGYSNTSLAHSNFSHGDFMVDNHRPLHKIHLSLDRKARLLVGYIALFGTFRYTVLLADGIKSELEWPGLDYTFNPVSQQKVLVNDNFAAPALTREEVLSPRNTPDEVLSALQYGQQVIVEHSPILEEVTVEAVRKDRTYKSAP